MKQFDGLYEGYYRTTTKKLSKTQFYILTMQGDLEDISVAYNSSSNVNNIS